jgi:hypothetical protein
MVIIYYFYYGIKACNAIFNTYGFTYSIVSVVKPFSQSSDGTATSFDSVAASMHLIKSKIKAALIYINLQEQKLRHFESCLHKTALHRHFADHTISSYQAAYEDEAY